MDGGSYEYLALILGRVLFFSQQMGLQTLIASDEKDRRRMIPRFDEQPHNLAVICASLNSPSALARNIPCSCKTTRVCEFSCDFNSIGVAKGWLWFKDHLRYFPNKLGFLPFCVNFVLFRGLGTLGKLEHIKD